MTAVLREALEVNASGGSITVVKPRDVEDGVLMIVVMNRDNTGNLADPTVVPAGWTWLASSAYNSNTGKAIIYWKIANGEPGSWTWSFANVARTNVEIFTVTGHDPATAPYANVTAASAAPTTTWTTAAIPTSVNNTLVIYGLATTGSGAGLTVAYPAAAQSVQTGTDAWKSTLGAEVVPTPASASRTLTTSASLSAVATFFVTIAPESSPLSGSRTFARRLVSTGVTRNDLREPEPWTDIPDAGGITSYDGGSFYAKPQFYKDALGWVHLRGMAKGSNTSWFTFPVGYRPNGTVHAPLMGTNAGTPRVAVVDISAAGVMGVGLPPSSTWDWFSLDGVSFHTSGFSAFSGEVVDDFLDTTLGMDIGALTWLSPWNVNPSGRESGANAGAGSTSAVFRDPQGWCYLLGSVQASTSGSGIAGQTITTIPAGFRPASAVILGTRLDSGDYPYRRLNLGADGTLSVPWAFTGSTDGGVYSPHRMRWRADDFVPSPNLASTLTSSPAKGGALVAAEAWIAPLLGNGWTNYGAPYAPAGYYRDAFGRVHLRGLITGGTVGAAAFTLPPGYRPVRNRSVLGASEIHLVQSNDTFGRLTVQDDGQVIPTSPYALWVSLEGVSFRAVA